MKILRNLFKRAYTLRNLNRLNFTRLLFSYKSADDDGDMAISRKKTLLCIKYTPNNYGKLRLEIYFKLDSLENDAIIINGRL